MPIAVVRPGLTSRTKGLTGEQAARRLLEHGPNELPEPERVRPWRSVGTQLRDPFLLVLMAAAVLTLATGDWADSIVILVVLVANTTVGAVQEVRADRAVAALHRLSAPAARVLRDGAQRLVPARELVPGDLVVLAEGDVVPADGVVLEAGGLLVDESALTGEAVSVDKSESHPEEQGRAVSAGTVVVKGRGLVEVVATGPASALGRVSGLLDQRVGRTPLQLRLDALGRVLAVVVLVLCAVVMGLALLHGQAVEDVLVTGVSLAVAAVPESLPAVVVVSLAMGARRMAQRHAIARRLPSVETLGSVSVLATDKTGTLTAGEMTVTDLWTPGVELRLTGTGYAPEGFLVDTAGAPVEVPREVRDLLVAVALCNDARLVPPDGQDGRWTVVGDPTEGALLAAAGKAGVTRVELDRRWTRTGEEPFDSRARRMVTAHRGAGGDGIVVVKGSPESVLTLALPGTLDAGAVLAAAERMARDGLRVLAVGTTVLDRAPQPADLSAAGVRLLGLVGLADLARPAARGTVLELRAAGVTPVLVTGDHPSTARAVALAAGVVDEPDAPVLTGEDLRRDPSLDVTSVRVLARMAPEQKLDVIAAWKRRGAVVAMTGDGVNDGPALRRADIGVAMGGRGSEVARQAADLVLADDSLETLVSAVEEGRRIYANVRRFLLFGLAGGAAEIGVMLAGPALGLAVPLLAAQILWVNLLTHGLTGVAMGAEPADPAAMRQPPRPAAESILGAGLWQRVLLLGAVVGAASLTAGVVSDLTGGPWQTVVFAAISCAQLGVAIGLRPPGASMVRGPVPAALAGSFALLLAGVYVPVLQQLLGTQALGAADLALAAAAGAVAFVAAVLTGALAGLRGRTSTRAGHDEDDARQGREGLT